MSKPQPTDFVPKWMQVDMANMPEPMTGVPTDEGETQTMSDEVITIKTTKAQVWRVLEFIMDGMIDDTKGTDAETAKMFQRKKEFFESDMGRFELMDADEKFKYCKKILTDLTIEFLRVGEQ